MKEERIYVWGSFFAGGLCLARTGDLWQAMMIAAVMYILSALAQLLMLFQKQ